MTSALAINAGIIGVTTPTVKLYVPDSETLVETVTLTEDTVRVGWYTGTTVTTSTGLYMLVFYMASDALGTMWVMLTNTSPTEDVATEDRYTSAVLDLDGSAGSDLHESYGEIHRAVGRFLFSQPDLDEWTAEQVQTVDDVVRSGLRMFLWPVVEGERYDWSFLKKTGTITTAAADDEYDLPDDFGGAIETVMFSSGANRKRLSRVSEGEILTLRGSDPRSGQPCYFAVSAVQPAAGDATTWELLLYPKPDKVYGLVYRYGICPDLDGATVHLGGAMHSEAVLEACLAAAEKTLRPELGPGIHHQRFEQMLAAAVASDRGLQ